MERHSVDAGHDSRTKNVVEDVNYYELFRYEGKTYRRGMMNCSGVVCQNIETNEATILPRDTEVTYAKD